MNISINTEAERAKQQPSQSRTNRIKRLNIILMKRVFFTNVYHIIEHQSVDLRLWFLTRSTFYLPVFFINFIEVHRIYKKIIELN